MGEAVQDRTPARRWRGVRRNLRSVPGPRLLVTVVLVGLAALASTPLAGEYQALQTYRNATVCPVGQSRSADGDDCLVRATGEVTDKEVGQSCTTDSYGAKSCAPKYLVRVRVPGRGETGWISTRHVTHREAVRGDRADVVLWQDDVVRLTVRGNTEKHEPYYGLKKHFAWLLMVAPLPLAVAVLVAVGRLGRMVFHPIAPIFLLGTPFILGQTVGFAFESLLFGNERLPLLLVTGMLSVGSIVMLVAFVELARGGLD